MIKKIMLGSVLVLVVSLFAASEARAGVQVSVNIGGGYHGGYYGGHPVVVAYPPAHCPPPVVYHRPVFHHYVYRPVVVHRPVQYRPVYRDHYGYRPVGRSYGFSDCGTSAVTYRHR
jgi:hypothetical protein